MVLTDWEYKILNILRPRVAGEEKFLGNQNAYRKSNFYVSICYLLSVRETYPLELCKHELPVLNEEKLHSLLANAKDNDTLKKGIINYIIESIVFK